MTTHEIQLIITVLIAVATVIFVPAVKRFWQTRREAQDARLAKMFALREEIEQKFAEMQANQDRQHAENRDFLDTIRTEAHQREGKILGSIQAASNQNRQESDRLGRELATVAQRVDRLFERMPGRVS